MAGRRKAPAKEPEAQVAEAVAEGTGEPMEAIEAPADGTEVELPAEEPKAEKKSSRKNAPSGSVDAHVTTSGSVAWMENGQHRHGETGTNISLPKEDFDRLSDLGMVEKGHAEGAPSMYQEPAEELGVRHAAGAIAVESAPEAEDLVTSQR